MLDAIRNFFNQSMIPAEGSERGPEPEDIRLAACALLLELAHADDEFTPDEREHLESAVRRQFGVDDAEAQQLLELAEAERRQAVDLWQFTNLVSRGYTTGQKAVLAEVMWGLVYADGDLAHRESYLMRKISNLLGLEPGYLAAAKRRAQGETSDEGHRALD